MGSFTGDVISVLTGLMKALDEHGDLDEHVHPGREVSIDLDYRSFYELVDGLNTESGTMTKPIDAVPPLKVCTQYGQITINCQYILDTLKKLQERQLSEANSK